MADLPQAIEQMLASRRLESVAVNHDHAVSVIKMAERHVPTARALSETDDQAGLYCGA